MWRIVALSLAALIGTNAQVLAVPESATYTFSLGNFVDVVGNQVPPLSSFAGSVTITYDPTLAYTNDTTDIVVNSLTLGSLSSAVGFTYNPSNSLLSIGAIQNNAGDIVGNTTDFVIQLFAPNGPTSATYGICSQTSLFSCGSATGNANVLASGYTVAASSSAFLAGSSGSTFAVPEPASIALLGIGLFALGAARRGRATAA